MQIGTFSLPIEVDSDDETFQKDLKKLPEFADAAAAVGCTRCQVQIAPAGDKRPYHENFEHHRRRFHAIASAFEPSGVRLALGFQASESLRRNQAFQFIHDLEATMQLINMIGSPNAGLLLDLWETFACGGNAEAIRKIPTAQIVALQIAEMPAEGAVADLDDKSRLLPDAEGRIGVASILAHLSDAGYDGPVTLRPSRSVFPSRRRDQVVKLASESLDKVWQAAGLPPTPRLFVASGAGASDFDMDWRGGRE